MPRSAGAARGANKSNFHPRKWQLWTMPAQAVAWLLGWEVCTIAAFVMVSLGEPAPGRYSLLIFAALVVCSAVHIAATKPSEERRRGARLQVGQVEHVDQTSIWLFSAALVLPIVLVAALVVSVRTQRYLIARRPPSRWLFSTCSIALSALGVHLVGGATPAAGLLAGIPHVSALGAACGVAAALCVYFAVQALLVGVARALVSGHWSPVDMIGTQADNMLIGYTLLLAVFAAIVTAFAPIALIAMVLVAIRNTRSEQRMAQLEDEREQLQVDALHDTLTGLPNRRGFRPEAELALVTDQAGGASTAVLMADLDHFKDWNTRLGHFGADIVLVAVARTLRAHTRSADLLCRWGGEEIAFVLPGTSSDEAAALAERLRHAVETLHVEVTKPAGGACAVVTGCTLSLGIAVTPEHGTE
ncbi:MAG: GGDEF domain-containing protein, partial [Sciscionella sp.]